MIPWVGRSPGGGNGNHSSILAGIIPWTEEPGGLQSMGCKRVGHDLETKQQQTVRKEGREGGRQGLLLLLLSHSVVSHSLQPHGLQPTRLLCPWNSSGKNTGVGCHALLQRILLTQGSNPGFLHCRWTPYHSLSQHRSPIRVLYIIQILCKCHSNLIFTFLKWK